MLDIAMCTGQGCPLKTRCYRFRAVTAGRQDTFGAPPYDAVRWECEEFWDVARLRPSDADIRARAYFLWVAAGRPEGTAEADWQRARAALEAEVEARLTPLDD
jgi:hypothetical protein